jgi:DNA-directed RNA polymerase II subunit RPB1
VTHHNILSLQQSVYDGCHVVGGAKTIIRDDVTTNLTKCRNDKYKLLQYGDIVERSLQDGDYVLMNRQPTLHRNSALAHTVRVMPGTTFRLNVMICPGYNADFDGDEMNLHLPQTLESQAELQNLVAVQKNLLSSQNGRPMIALHQDNLIAVYLLTLSHQYFRWSQVCDLLYEVPERIHSLVPCILKPIQLWSGKQIVSVLLPPDFHYSYKDLVLIADSELLFGTLGKDNIGSKSEGIVHLMYRYYGDHATMQFLDQIQNLLRRFMELHAFSVGLGDAVLTSDKQALVPKAKLGNHIFQDETAALIELSKEMGVIGKNVQEQMEPYNSFRCMIAAGSKGSTTNITQISGIVGQQLVTGKRIQIDMKNRTLSHYHKHDYHAAALGYITGNYINGLDPIQFFFHTAGGREGLTDTAVKSVTWETRILIGTVFS